MRGQERPLRDSVGALRSPDTEIRMKEKATVSGINLQIYCEVQVPRNSLAGISLPDEHLFADGTEGATTIGLTILRFAPVKLQFPRLDSKHLKLVLRNEVLNIELLARELQIQKLFAHALNPAARTMPKCEEFPSRCCRDTRVDNQTTRCLRPRLSPARKDKKLSPHLYLCSLIT